MSLVTPADVNAVNAGGGLSDANLQAVIDREEAEIIRRFGAHYVDGSTTVSETVPGERLSIYLRRALTSVSSIVEYDYLGDTSPATLTSTDYYTWSAQGRIERLPRGVRWGAAVVVTYVPADDNDLRSQVLIELVRVGAAQNTGQAVSGLGYSIGGNVSAQDWQHARAMQYTRLSMAVGDT